MQMYTHIHTNTRGEPKQQRFTRSHSNLALARWPETEKVSTVRKPTGAPTPYRKKVTFQKMTMTQAGPHPRPLSSHPSSYPVSQSGDMRQKDKSTWKKLPKGELRSTLSCG